MNKVVKDIEYLRNISESVESAQEASDIISKLTTAIKDVNYPQTKDLGACNVRGTKRLAD